MRYVGKVVSMDGEELGTVREVRQLPGGGVELILSTGRRLLFVDKFKERRRPSPGKVARYFGWNCGE